MLLDEASLWPDKKFVITNIIVSQKFLKEHPDVVEAVLRGSVKTNKWINANPDKAKAVGQHAAGEADSGKALPAERPRPGVEVDPVHSTTRWPPRSTPRRTHAVKAGLLEKPDLKGIYDLTLAEQGPQGRGRARRSTTPASAPVAASRTDPDRVPRR